MKVVTVRELYRAGILSQGEGWEIIYNSLKDMGVLDSSDEVQLDFSGINVVAPYKHYYFKVLLKLDNIHMKFYNIEQDVNQIHIICIMEGYNKDRITCEVRKKEEKVPTQELKIIGAAMKLVDKFQNVGNNTLRLNIRDTYGQMNNGMTVKYIEYAMVKVLEDIGDSVKEVILDINGVIIVNRALELLVDLKVYIEDKFNVSVAFDVENPEHINKLNLYMHSKTKKEYSLEDKVEEIRKMPKNTVGILIQYKRSRAIDEFGRHGHGEVASSRVSIFKGLSTGKDIDGNKEIFVKFTSYNSNKLYTRAHWALEKDGAQLDELESYDVAIPINQLGFTDKFIGSQYHFIMPVQEELSENVDMFGINDEGKVIRNSYTVPERVKAVFDDFGIEYDELELSKAIKKTRDKLYGSM